VRERESREIDAAPAPAGDLARGDLARLDLPWLLVRVLDLPRLLLPVLGPCTPARVRWARCSQA